MSKDSITKPVSSDSALKSRQGQDAAACAQLLKALPGRAVANDKGTLQSQLRRQRQAQKAARQLSEPRHQHVGDGGLFMDAKLLVRLPKTQQTKHRKKNLSWQSYAWSQTVLLFYSSLFLSASFPSVTLVP